MHKAKSIMIQGTTSNAGKSLVTAGLCRIFAQDGYKVAPFKSQNMALNSYITEDGLEMGRAQVVQAQAAYKKPDVRMNPVLLKPTSDKGSQVIVNGEVIGNMSAVDYFKYKIELIPEIKKAYEALAAENDIIVIEGAGSPAEINLKENDIVNMGMAKIAKSPVLIVGDIDRGGVFASLYGTFMLQTQEEKSYIKGNIINKFRGDVNILMPGIKMLEDLVPVKTLGVVPMLDINIDDEDSLSDNFSIKTSASQIDIAVIRLPRISNFTDFNAFEMFLGAKVRYITGTKEFKKPDLLIIPGTKNTIGDLKWLRESGLETEILKHINAGGAVFGICGGYQMLCKQLEDPFETEEGGKIRGIGAFDAVTVFEKEKTRTRISGTFKNAGGIFSNLNGKLFEGYEIHMGKTYSDLPSINELKTLDDVLKKDGLCEGNIYGTYVHGIFDKFEVVEVIVKALCAKKGIDFDFNSRETLESYREKQYDKLALALRNSLDMNMIYKILDEGVGI